MRECSRGAGNEAGELDGGEEEGLEGLEGGEGDGGVRVAGEFDEAFNELLLSELAAGEGEAGALEGEEGEGDGLGGVRGGGGWVRV